MAIIRDIKAREAIRDAIVLDLGDLAAQGKRLHDQAMEHAKGIINDANVRRKQLIDTAHEEGRSAGLAKGLAEGKAKGESEGFEAARTQAAKSAEKLISMWNEALGAFEAERAKLLVAAREDVLKIAIMLAQRVVGRIVEVDPQVASRQLEQLLPMVLSRTSLIVRCHPQDAEELTRLLPTLSQRFEHATDAKVVSDSTLSRGSCVVSNAAGGSIDASIGTQLTRLAEALIPGSGGKIE
jgi:flagellar biosynthesis/type III secretory pathway protein FliH